LMLVHAQDYRAPRHRHNFDQVRFMLQGEFSFDRGQTLRAGMAGYFPEGTYYTQRGFDHSTTLLLQSGGASRSGYMSDRQLRAAIEELKRIGEFHDGFFWHRDDSGKLKHKDGYEAAWEHVHGRSLQYPNPLFKSPILWHEDDFAWQPLGDDGAAWRDFCSLTHLKLGIAQLRMPPGSRHTLDAAQQATLLYTIDGRLRMAGQIDDELRPVSSVHLERGESIGLEAIDASTLYVLRLMSL
jgi:hypothetical protein